MAERLIRCGRCGSKGEFSHGGTSWHCPRCRLWFGVCWWCKFPSFWGGTTNGVGPCCDPRQRRELMRPRPEAAKKGQPRCNRSILESDVFTNCARVRGHKGDCASLWHCEERLPSVAEMEGSLQTVVKNATRRRAR